MFERFSRRLDQRACAVTPRAPMPFVQGKADGALVRDLHPSQTTRHTAGLRRSAKGAA